MAGLADILSGLNQGLSDPSNAGLMGFAQGLMQAGAPHMLTPVPMGQALGQGMASSQQYQGAALQNAMQRASVPFQQMKTATFIRAYRTMQDPKASAQDKAAAKALMYSLVGGPGLGTAIYTNDPNVVGPKEAAISQNKPVPVPANERLFGPHGPLSVGAQGSLPEGTVQGAARGVPGTPGGPALGSLDLSFMPGAPAAITANAFNKAGGAAAATLPYDLSKSYHTRAPGAAGGTLGPRPARPFIPMPGPGGVPPQVPPAANPQTIAAAQAAARQRQMGMAQGLSQAAPNASPAPQPSIPAPQGVPPSPPVPAAPAASGGGLTSQGMTPSEVTGQQTAQKLATAQLSADVTSGQEAQQRVANLEELNAVASGLKTGPGMDAHVAVLKALESVPGVLGASASKLLPTITNAQIFNKQSLNLSLQTVSQAGQHAYDAYKSVMNAFPELSKTNMANAVVTAGLLATARYQADRGTFASKWQQQNQGMGYVPGKGTAEGTWTQNAPFMAYFMNALPPEAQKMIVAKARTNTTLRMEIQRAQQGWRWLSANGYQ